MAALGSAATRKVRNIMTAPTNGLGAAIGAISANESVALPTIDPSRVVALNVAYDTVERTAGATYPAMYVYCEGLENLQKEKFRTFSGKAYMVMEVRVTHDHVEGVSRNLEYYAGAAANVLTGNHGDWGDGMFYTGGYKVEFGPIKHGGKNFIQTAKIVFEVEVSY